MALLTTTDPRTGVAIPTDIVETSAAQVEAIAEAAAVAGDHLGELTRLERAALLEAIAEGIEAGRAGLVRIADAETGLGQPRLEGELTRSVGQFLLFAEAVRDGGYLEAAIDSATEAAPDIRRMLVPIGPVAVFGASNFPFAFSVLGGDTASALAAGNPVVVKAHESHPLTSRLSGELLVAALERFGAPKGTFGIVYGRAAGAHLVADPHIRAVTFTGSLAGGAALQQLINNRPTPIPFFGELSSVNPVVITELAAAARKEEIALGLLKSVGDSGGQLCTKPGVVFIPAGMAGDGLLDVVRDLVRAAGGRLLLNAGIHSSFHTAVDHLGTLPGVTTVRSQASDTGFEVPVTMFEVDSSRFSGSLTHEVFGPSVVAVRYQDEAGLLEALGEVPDSLAGSIHFAAGDEELVSTLRRALENTVGRVLFNGFPTGVRVSWAQNHGGPWPSTNSLHTSVGVTSMRRFLRPLAWQNAPASQLPAELRDGPIDVPRRVDGRLELAHEPR